MPRRRVLVLAPFTPSTSGRHGGSRLMAQWIAQLARRHRVALLSLRWPEEPPTDPVLASACDLLREITPPAPPPGRLRQLGSRATRRLGILRGRPRWVTAVRVPAFAAAARELVAGWAPEVVQIEYHVMGQYVPALEGSTAPRVLTNYDPGLSAARERYAAGRGVSRIKNALDLRAWRSYEGKVLRSVHAAVVFSDRDRRVLLPLAGTTPVVRITPGLDLPAHPLSAVGTDPSSVLFVGNFQHFPNVSAARRLITEILPRVHASHPTATATIVGSSPPAYLRALAGERVAVTGWVPDATPYLDRAAVVVAPITEGGGIRIKVLEALAAGKAVVASPLGAEGVPLGDSAPLLLAESDEELAAAIANLLADPARRAALGSRARAWAAAHLGWQRSMDAFDELYDRLLRGQPPGRGDQGVDAIETRWSAPPLRCGGM